MKTQSLAMLKNSLNSQDWVSKWFLIDQNLINQFADVTQDHQFIHVDPQKASETPFGTTIAHGFLTTSLLSAMYYDAIPQTKGMSMGINYGFDKLRFLSPVKCNAHIRGRFRLTNIIENSNQELTLYWACKVEIKDEERPALIARWIERQYTQESA